MRFTRPAAAFAAAALSITVLAGCSGEQSVEEACTTANEATAELQNELAGLSATTEPAELIAQFELLEDGMADAASQVSNEEVGGALTEARDALATINSELSAAGGDLTGLGTEASAAAAQDLQNAGTRLVELCGS